MGKDSHKPSLSTTTLIVLVIVTFFTSLYMKGLNTGIPYYYDMLGYSATVGGTFVAVFTLSSTVMRLVGGQITDHFPHYRVLLISLTIMLIGAILPAIFNEFYLAMASRILQGASFAVATNVMTVAVIGSSKKQHIGRRLGINGAGTSLGTMFGALVSTGLLDSIGYLGFYGFYAALMVVAIVAVLLLRKTRASHGSATLDEASAVTNVSNPQDSQTSQTAKAPSENPKAPSPSSDHSIPSSTLSNRTSLAKSTDEVPQQKPKSGFLHEFIATFLIPQAIPFMVISFARRIPKGFCVAFILVFAKYAGIGAGAVFFVVVGATTLACRLLGGKVFDSNRTWLLLPLQSAQIIGFIAFALKPSMVTLIIAAIGYGVSVGTTSPLVKALMAKSTPKEHWGAVNGELFFFADIGKALSAFCGGLIIDALSKDYIPLIALIFCIISSVIVAIALLVGRRVWARK